MASKDYKVNLGIQFTGKDELNNIKTQIDSLTKSTHKIKFEVDSSQLKTLSTDLKTITDKNKLTIDTSKFESSLSKMATSIDAIKTKLSSIKSVNIGGSGSTSNATKQIDEQTRAYNELLAVRKQISKKEVTLEGLKNAGGNSNQISVLEKQLQGLRTTYDAIRSSMTQPMNDGQWSGIFAEIDKMKQELALVDAKFADTQSKLASGITAKFNNGDFDSQLSALDSKLGNINNKTAELSGTVETAKYSFSALGVAIQEGDPAKIVTAYENYQNALKKAINEATVLLNKQKEQAKAEKELANAQKLTTDKAVFKQQLDQWREMYSAALPQFGARIDEIESKLQSANNTDLANLRQQLKLVTLEAQNAGVGMQTFGDRLKSQLSKLGIYVTGITAITKAMQALRSMYQQTLAVDTAMTELYRVTDLSSSQYATLYEKMTASAKEYGSTLDGLINSTASWVRLGFDPNEANKLAEITSMYQHVTDLDEETAVNNLVTAYKGFENQLLELTNGDKTQAVETVADVYDALGRHNCPHM